MSKDYTIEEFAALIGDIAENKVDDLCVNVVKSVGKTFLKKVVRETPQGSGSYTFPDKFKGYKKSTTGLREGWNDNRSFNISKGTHVYTAVLTNKAKSHYKSGYTGRSRSDYYAYYVDEGHMIRPSLKLNTQSNHGKLKATARDPYIPFLDATVKPQFIKGKHFTDRSIDFTENKLDSIVNKEFSKWFNEVF